MATGEIIAAQTHCPFCGQPLAEMIRHLLGQK